MINKPILSSTLTTARTISWLNLQGLPVLPVAPWQDYPRCGKGDRPVFTGKNPSFLDKDGRPHLIPHRYYQSRLPGRCEVDRWFANPANGVMTMGGWGDFYWIDVDVKRYVSEQVCDRAVDNWCPEERPQSIGSSPGGRGFTCSNPRSPRRATAMSNSPMLTSLVRVFQSSIAPKSDRNLVTP